MYYAIQTTQGSKIFESWDECAAFRDLAPKNARYKKFPKREQAEKFLNLKPAADSSEREEKTSGERMTGEIPQAVQKHRNADPFILWGCTDVIAYTDGSFNANTGVWGYGAVVFDQDGKELLHCSGNGTDYASSRNVTGEIYGVVRIVEEAVRQKCSSICIRYDYTGVEYWVNGSWKAQTELTRWYRDYMQKLSEDISILFEKVPAHSGVPGNEKADQLAKAACMK